MKTNLPDVKGWLSEKGIDADDPLFGGNMRFLRFQDLLKEYGRLCAKHGAKRIREQAIESVEDASDYILLLVDDNATRSVNDCLEGIVSEIQNLEP